MIITNPKQRRFDTESPNPVWVPRHIKFFNELEKLPSINHIEVKYNRFRKFYRIHTLNRILLGEQTDIIFSNKFNIWVCQLEQSSNTFTEIESNLFKSFLIEANINLKEFNEFILFFDPIHKALQEDIENEIIKS